MESKEVMLEEEVAPAPVAPVVVHRGPPRFAKPLGVTIKRGELPKDFEERLLPAIQPERVVDRTAKPPRTAKPSRPGLVVDEMMPEEEGESKTEEAPAAAQETQVSALPERLQELSEHVQAAERKEKAAEPLPYYKLPTRRDFIQFVIQAFHKYKLPKVSDEIDPDACQKAGVTAKEIKTFLYQSFVRDFMQKASPYRGILVYHGLGSGKTCTSIATMESLYIKNQRPVYILTPASLSANYKDEIAKCGPYIFRTDNHWVWVPVPDVSKATAERELLRSVGIPVPLIREKKGAWLPDTTKKSNFNELSNAHQAQIKEQIKKHIDERFVFINYNGITKQSFRDLFACREKQGLRHAFDGATVVIDEVHNLIRNINNADLETIYKDAKENRNAGATYNPGVCSSKDLRVSYTLYRMLCNAVGAKIVALSATPIINFPQEVAILANMLGGDIRLAKIPIAGMDKKSQIETMLSQHPEVEYAKVVTDTSANRTVVEVTPVPSGFRKVVKDGSFRGYVRSPQIAGVDVEVERERNANEWALRVAKSVRDARLGAIDDKTITIRCVPRLPDTPKQFEDVFIDKENMKVYDARSMILKGRLSGLISYYRGGKKDYMAQEINHTVELEMSGNQLAKYTVQRKLEIDRERKQAKKTRFEMTKESVNSTFKIFSRAACNFAFPDDIDRPIPRDEETWGRLLTGEKQVTAAAAESGAEAVVDTEEGVVEEQAQVAPLPQTQEVKSYQEALVAVVAQMRARSAEFFSRETLPNFSPKFQAILDNIESSEGPVLVYSNFKTLEGVGLFGVALESQKMYAKLDIVRSGESWVLTPETLASNKDTPRYIMYTGDEDRDKRNILLAIFNGKWEKVPKSLAKSVQEHFGVQNNIEGKIARVIMITQSGAEGISLANVRQVHIMEPYWNYVRLEQVKGRAVRICSHMDLPLDKRVVDIYTYIMKFSKSYKIDETLQNIDKSMTTDQQIYQLMEDKKKIADSILDVMKASAVDCELNKTENTREGENVACYTLKDASSNPIFYPLLEDDLSKIAAEIKAV